MMRGVLTRVVEGATDSSVEAYLDFSIDPPRDRRNVIRDLSILLLHHKALNQLYFLAAQLPTVFASGSALRTAAIQLMMTDGGRGS